MKVLLLADTKYRDSFANLLRSAPGIELVDSKPDVIVDAAFLSPYAKIAALQALVEKAPIVTNTLTVSATSVRAALDNAAEVVGLSVFPNYIDRQKTVEYSLPFGISKASAPFSQLLDALDKSGEEIKDTIGGVFPRTLAMIVNEATFAVQESVATAADIDTAMKLGTNYPKGPLAWCDEIGADAIVAVLDALAKEYGPERYRVATLLRRYAESGLKFLD